MKKPATRMASPSITETTALALFNFGIWKLLFSSASFDDEKAKRDGIAAKRLRFDSSAYGVSAVHRECVTDHETRCRTAKPEHSARDLLRTPEPADGYVLQHCVQRVGLS